MEWIGRDCMRAMFRGRPQRRESCDGLNQDAGCRSQPEANLLLSFLGQRFRGRIISGRLRELVGPCVDDRMTIDVLDAGRDALLELLF